MGFFKKLKERLFKSSSKIDEGLDAIIEDGGQAEEVELEEDLKTQKETVDYFQFQKLMNFRKQHLTLNLFQLILDLLELP